MDTPKFVTIRVRRDDLSDRLQLDVEEYNETGDLIAADSGGDLLLHDVLFSVGQSVARLGVQ